MKEKNHHSHEKEKCKRTKKRKHVRNENKTAKMKKTVQGKLNKN